MNKKRIIILILVMTLIVFGFYYFKIKTQTKPTPENQTEIIYKNNLFSITIPKDYRTEESYVYQLSPDKSINGVQFIIPASKTTRTNLSQDTYISVENIPNATNSCSAEIYLDNPTKAGFADVGKHRYSIALSNGAAAGNRYEEIVYATPVKGGCLAVRYFIHYGVFENYPEGSIVKFDAQALLDEFDSIRKSLTIK